MAVFGGFVAILFVLQPGGGVDPLATGLLLASNLFFGLGAILTRVVSRLDDPAPMTFYTLLTFVVFGAAIALIGFLTWVDVQGAVDVDGSELEALPFVSVSPQSGLVLTTIAGAIAATLGLAGIRLDAPPPKRNDSLPKRPATPRRYPGK